MTPAELDTILAQDDWLRRIARHLVRDADLADDLVQDAWVASLEAGRRGDSARPWLLGVLRNTGARLFRTASSQHERALRSAEGAETEAPATDDVAASLQLRETLARELRALDEPFRSAVYLRYIDNLTLKQAARRAGVAPSTLSERVTRGLELLRLRMDRAHGGERRAWALPLFPLARTSGLAALAMGSAVMTGTVKLALSAAVIGGLLFFVPRLTSTENTPNSELLQLEPEQGKEELSPRSTGTESLAAVESLQAARVAGGVAVASRPVPAVAPDADGTDAQIVSRFLLPDGRPAAGAQWTLDGRRGNSERVLKFGLPEDWTDLSGELDSNGALELSFDPPQAFQFMLAISAPEHVEAGWRWGQIQPSEAKDLGTVTLEPAGRISGRVIDEDGIPLIGRKMTAYAERRRDSTANILSGREGTYSHATVDTATARFEFDGMPEGRVQLTVQEKVLGHVKGPVAQVLPGETVEIDVVLKGAHETGSKIVVAALSRPYYTVPRATFDFIWLVAPDGTRRNAKAPEPHRTNVVFENVGPGVHAVVIDDPRFETWRSEGVVGGDVLRPRLVGSAAIALDVRDTEGEPIDLYSVHIEFLNVNFRPREFRPHSGAEPLEEGTLRALVPGDYRVTLHGEPGVAAVNIMELGPSETRTVKLVLGEPDIIGGRVIRSDGSPIVGLKARLVSPADSGDSPRTLVIPKTDPARTQGIYRLEQASTMTDTLGRFTFQRPVDGQYLILVGENGRPSVESEILSVALGESNEEIELTLPDGARVSGRVSFPTGLETSGWYVLADRPDFANNLRPFVERVPIGWNGSFTTDDLDAGKVRLLLFRPESSLSYDAKLGWIGGRLLEELVIENGQDLVRTYEFPGAVPTSVRFELQVEGFETDFAMVNLVPHDVRSPREITPGPLTGREPVLLAPGKYDVQLGGYGWSYNVPGPVTIIEREPQVIHLTAPLKARRVRLVQSGTPVASRMVMISQPAGRRELRVTRDTDREGWVDIRLAAGAFAFRLAQVGDIAERDTMVTWPLPEGVTEIEID